MKKKIFIIVGILVLLLLFLFAFRARQSERSIVQAVSDFYISLLSEEETQSVSMELPVTDRFFGILESPTTSQTVTCGLSLPKEVRVGKAAAFLNDGTASVAFKEATSSREAIIILRKVDATWKIDGIACQL